MHAQILVASQKFNNYHEAYHYISICVHIFYTLNLNTGKRTVNVSNRNLIVENMPDQFLFTERHNYYFNFAFVLIIMFVLSAIEYVGPKNRVVVAMMLAMIWTSTNLSLTFLAYFLRNWRHLQLAITALEVIALLCFIL